MAYIFSFEKSFCEVINPHVLESLSIHQVAKQRIFPGRGCQLKELTP